MSVTNVHDAVATLGANGESVILFSICFFHKTLCVWCCRGLVITMVVSLLFILLLRFTAGVLLWLVIFGVITAVGYGEDAETAACG